MVGFIDVVVVVATIYYKVFQSRARTVWQFFAGLSGATHQTITCHLCHLFRHKIYIPICSRGGDYTNRMQYFCIKARITMHVDFGFLSDRCKE